MLRPLSMVSAVLISTLAVSAMAADSLPPPSRWVSPDAILSVEISQPQAILDLAFDKGLAKLLEALPDYEKTKSQPNVQNLFKLGQYLEQRFGSDTRTILTKFFGGGLTLAVGAQGGMLLIVDAQDEQTLQQVNEALLGIARSEAEKWGGSDPAQSSAYQGVKTWTFGGSISHALVGRRLLLANRPAVLTAALDLKSRPGDACLAAQPAYQAARKAVGADAQGMVFVDLAAVKHRPWIEKALSQAAAPIPVLLFAGLTQSVRDSHWLALGLRVDANLIRLEARMDGKLPPASPIAAFSQPEKQDEGVWPNLCVPRRIAAMSVYRDLARFYTAKDQLFPERTSGLIFFENMMGIFFSGRNLTDEVLAETRPEIRVVVAQQEYDSAAGVPHIQLPSFAVIFRMRHPRQFGDVIEEAWQKAIGLVNVTRGQQAKPGMIIDRPTYHGVCYTAARFAPSVKAPEDQIGSRSNVRPALLKLDDYLVLGSAESLTRDLIDALKKESAAGPKAISGTHSLVEFDGVQTAALVSADRKIAVRQNMTSKGLSAEEAERNIDAIITALKGLGQSTMSIGSRDGQFQAALEVKLNLPR